MTKSIELSLIRFNVSKQFSLYTSFTSIKKYLLIGSCKDTQFYCYLQFNIFKKMLTEIEVFVIKKVKEFRTEKKVSQAELSDRIGVSLGFIGKVESIKYNTKYNLNHINKISKALEISPRDLLPTHHL